MKRLQIENPFENAPVFYLETTNSTMDDAAAFAFSGCLSGTVVSAGYQRAGTGRLAGRAWHSNPGESLLFTIILDPAQLPSGAGPFPLIAGLALAKVLEKNLSLKPRIKWPNDVLVDGKKIAGILCRLKPPWLYMGMGVNCLQKSFPGELAEKATSFVLSGGNLKRSLSMLPPFLKSLRYHIALDNWQAEVERRLYRKDERVRVRSGVPGKETETDAVLRGITADGALRLENPDASEIITLLSGEILS